MSWAWESGLGTSAQLPFALTVTTLITRTRARPTVITALAGSPVVFSSAPARGFTAASGVARDTGDAPDGVGTAATASMAAAGSEDVVKLAGFTVEAPSTVPVGVSTVAAASMVVVEASTAVAAATVEVTGKPLS